MEKAAALIQANFRGFTERRPFMWEGMYNIRCRPKPYQDFDGNYDAQMDASRDMEDIAKSLEQDSRVWPWDLHDSAPEEYIVRAGVGEPYTISDVLNERMIKWLLRYNRRQLHFLAPDWLEHVVLHTIKQRVKRIMSVLRCIPAMKRWATRAGNACYHPNGRVAKRLRREWGRNNVVCEIRLRCANRM